MFSRLCEQFDITCVEIIFFECELVTAELGYVIIFD